MQAQKVAAAQGVSWIACGVRLFWRDASTWIVMTALYFIIALALKNIPFVGNLVLVLITPALLAGALLTARELDEPHAIGSSVIARGIVARLTDSPRRLFRAFARNDRAVGALITCVLTLGLTMIAIVVDYLLTAGSMLTGVAGRALTEPFRPLPLLGGAVVLLVYGILVLSLFHLVHLTTLAGLEAMAAAAASMRGALRNLVPLLIFVIGFIAVAAGIVTAFGNRDTRWLGYLLLFSVGATLLPIFVAGSYCSYRSLYRSAPPTMS